MSKRYKNKSNLDSGDLMTSLEESIFSQLEINELFDNLKTKFDLNHSKIISLEDLSQFSLKKSLCIFVIKK